MDAVPADKAGVGSAMNDATRELGGVLGVAIVGSVVASAYTAAIAGAPRIPADMGTAAGESIGAASAVADRLDGPAGQALLQAAQEAFVHAADRGVLIAAAVALAGAVAVWLTLPAHDTAPGRDVASATAAAVHTTPA